MCCSGFIISGILSWGQFKHVFKVFQSFITLYLMKEMGKNKIPIRFLCCKGLIGPVCLAAALYILHACMKC